VLLAMADEADDAPDAGRERPKTPLNYHPNQLARKKTKRKMGKGEGNLGLDAVGIRRPGYVCCCLVDWKI